MGHLEPGPAVVSFLKLIAQLCSAAYKTQRLRYFARLLIVEFVSTAPKRSYSIEDFSELINLRITKLEKHQEARQRYGGLLAVLRQQFDAYRNQYHFTK